MLKIYTDGSCLGNPGPGGWAALVVNDQMEEHLISGASANTTNNRMELTAAIEGLKLASGEKEVELYTDSKYVMDAFEKAWIVNWQRNNWKNASKKPVKNDDLWKELIKLTSSIKVNWNWVKGHSGHKENEVVDQAARAAALQI